MHLLTVLLCVVKVVVIVAEPVCFQSAHVRKHEILLRVMAGATSTLINSHFDYFCIKF